MLSPMCITHLSTSRLGPLFDETISLKMGALLHMVSIYSNNTFDCLNAAPTITIFLRGIKNARIMAYSDKTNDFPRPREPTSIGNRRPHNSLRIRACIGSTSMLNTSLAAKLKYSGCINSQAKRS